MDRNDRLTPEKFFFTASYATFMITEGQILMFHCFEVTRQPCMP